MAASIRELVSTSQPRVQRAFLAAVADITDQASITAIRNALLNGGIEAAIDAIGIEPAAFSGVRAELLDLYGKSGVATVDGTTWRYPNGHRVVVRYNADNPRVEEWGRVNGAELIRGLSDEAKRVAANTIADGYALGRSRDRIALDLIGRIGANGKRTGGVVGLNDLQQRWVTNAARYLNDPATMQRFLDMKRTDRRMDGVIKRAIASGQPLTQAQIDRILQTYKNSKLKERALTIARTEARKASEGGKYEGWRQGLERTGVPERFVVREWVHTGRAVDDRPWHMLANGMTVRGLQVPFVLSSGAAMLHPQDTSYGAGAVECVNCECEAKYYIDRVGLSSWQG